MGALAGAQQVPGGAAAAPLPVGVGVAPRAPEVPALGVRLEAEDLDDAVGVHARSLLRAARCLLGSGAMSEAAANAFALFQADVGNDEGTASGSRSRRTRSTSSPT